jgi:hypothetical protein
MFSYKILFRTGRLKTQKPLTIALCEKIIKITTFVAL